MKNDKKNWIQYDFAIEQYPTPEFSHYTYFIRSGDEAIILDPMTEPSLYITLLKETLTKLKYVFLTHDAIDFISGAQQLANITGATIIKSCEQNKDNTEFSLGKISLKLIKTPGFTLDSCCYLLTNSKKNSQAIFTGGLILFGDIGLPIQSLPNRPAPAIATVYESLSKITAMTQANPNIVFYPSYTEGACFNPNIQVDTSQYLLEQINENKLLSMTKDQFIEAVNKMPLMQAKFFIENIQKSKITKNIDDLLNAIPALSCEDVANLMKEDNVYIVDTRDLPFSTKGTIPSSVLLPIKISFNKFLPSLIPTNSKLILLTGPGMEKDIVLSCLRVGYENILGCLKGGLTSWIRGGKAPFKIPYEESVKLQSLLEQGKKVIDVREISEYKTDGIVKNTHLIPLTELSLKINDILQVDDLYVLCKSGGRAAIAASYLIRKGYKGKISVIIGGCMKLKEDKYSFANYQ